METAKFAVLFTALLLMTIAFYPIDNIYSKKSSHDDKTVTVSNVTNFKFDAGKVDDLHMIISNAVPPGPQGPPGTTTIILCNPNNTIPQCPHGPTPDVTPPVTQPPTPPVTPIPTPPVTPNPTNPVINSTENNSGNVTGSGE